MSTSYNRTQAIVNYVNAHHYASFSELRDEFGVSNATMRRDLTMLDEKGLIKRVHGGAKALSMVDERDTSIKVRLALNVKEKEAISRYALSILKNGDSVILDSSTTMLPLARMIAESDLRLTVITNNLGIAEILNDCDHIDFYMLGGIVKSTYKATMGPFTEKMLRSIQADKYFMGVDSISLENGLRNTHYDIIPLKQISLENSVRHYVLADHTKFNSLSFLPVCSLSEIDEIITDAGLSDDIYNAYLARGIKITRV